MPRVVPKLDLDPNELLTRHQIAAELGIHVNTLNYWRRRHGIPVYGPRRHRLYRRGDLYEFLEQQGEGV